MERNLTNKTKISLKRWKAAGEFIKNPNVILSFVYRGLLVYSITDEKIAEATDMWKLASAVLVFLQLILDLGVKVRRVGIYLLEENGKLQNRIIDRFKNQVDPE